MAHDPGGKTTYPLQPGVHGSAFITADQIHRIWLARVWGRNAKFALFIGANPSTAAADVDDPTVRREMAFAQSWGVDGYFKVNVSSVRETKPENLLRHAVLQHPDNVDTIRRVAKRASIVVLAYGALRPRLQVLADALVAQLQADRVVLQCLGLTKAGHPRHPLYLAKNTALELFIAPRVLPPCSNP